MRFVRSLLVLTTIATLVGCGEDLTNPDFDGTARVSINNLADWTLVSGTVQLQIGPMMEYKLAKLELLRGSDGALVASTGGEALAINWDTTQTADGIESVWVRATDKGDNIVESSIVKLVVLNQGQAAAFISGENSGEVSIPASYNGTQEVDVLQHWNTPAGVRSIIAVLNWTTGEGQLEWDIGLAIGRGICPHRGTAYGDEPASTVSPLTLRVDASAVSATATEFPPTGPVPDPLVDQYFVHLRPNNPGDHVGETIPYRVDVFLLQ